MGLKPQTGATLVLLRIRGEDGLTPDEARRWAGTDRLAALGAQLAQGHEIETTYQTVRGKRFARYVLRERKAGYASDNLEGVPEGELRLLWGSR